ncbi:hypothetical protein DXA85_02800 [Propionibacterium sp. KPL2009]|nr:hypothetical protein DXA85_02800 [Propionibacterium sp. KPL2009]
MRNRWNSSHRLDYSREYVTRRSRLEGYPDDSSRIFPCTRSDSSMRWNSSQAAVSAKGNYPHSYVDVVV